jgi:error-prone DNA polymerase
MSAVPYAELGCRSSFSFLEATALPEDLAARAAELDVGVVALSDYGGVYGAPRFHQAAKKVGIRAVVGAGIDVDGVGRVRLLCESRQGYKNLCRLVTLGHQRSDKGKCAVEPGDLTRFAEGLICLAGSDPYTVDTRLSVLARIYSTEHLFIEVTRHLDRRRDQIAERRLDLADATGLRPLATNDVRLLRPDDKPLHDVLTCIHEHVSLETAGRRLLPNGEARLKSPAEMAALFRDRPDAVRTALEVADRCAFGLADLGYRFPDYPVPPGETQASYLRALTWAGAAERYRPLHDAARAQITRELALIEKLDLAGYFLIVEDIVRYAREQRILAQGRGSAANSAVCYALGITAVDPVGMGLLFERFLSEERGEWPDIDLDLPSGDERERVIQYVYGKYGVASAAMTANVITYRDKSALREAGKALGFTLPELDKVSKVCGHWSDIDEWLWFEERMGMAGLDPREPRVRAWMELSRRLLHLPRHLGQHSGGMVIARGRLDEVVPLEPATMPGRVVIQWDKDDCSDLGIIKVDLLGLGMLQVLEEAVPLIRTTHGVDIDYAHLPPDDPAVYGMMQKADTVGVFQIESRAQMATLPRLKPSRFYDLVVEIALIRPGPIQGNMVHPYLKRRAGREPVTYAHPSLEPILARTLGVPLFQEQLMRMAMSVAGFTGGEAEELRRAMGFKRSMERMREIEGRLREGIRARGIGPESEEEIVRSITSFALYGFPESHSASFALIAYASAYLKAHYPAAFLCALLNAWPMGFYHPSTLVKDAQRHGVHVKPIDVTRSDWKCTLEDPLTVRLGLRYARGLKQRAGEAIVAARAERPFTTSSDVANRATLVEKELDTLAELGAFAALGETRRQALWQLAGLSRRAFGLFAGVSDPDDESPLPEMSLPERVHADFRTSGMSVGPHPMAFVRPLLEREGVLSADAMNHTADGTRVAVAGLVRVRQRPMTAKGFFFMTLEDETGFANIIVRPDLFERDRAVLIGAGGLVARGRVQNQDGVVTLKVDSADDLAKAYPGAPLAAEPDAWATRFG